MIVVDTSVWISALRDSTGEAARILRGLLDADEVALPVPVRSELLMGTSGGTRAQLAERLSALPLLYPTDETWQTLDAWAARATKAGHTFSLGDLIVGVVASEAGAPVWSLDKDFERMEKLKLISLFS